MGVNPTFLGKAMNLEQTRFTGMLIQANGMDPAEFSCEDHSQNSAH
jgi:hypothetical protein